MEDIQTTGLMDWFVRYTTILKKRNTHKQKGLFLTSIQADIESFRADVQVDEFKLHPKDPYTYHNVYVGDMSRANTIICTYYDTPTTLWQPYHYFDVKRREQNATRWIWLSALLYFAVGLLFTLKVAIPMLSAGPLFAFWPIVTIVGYIAYFLLMGQITRGWPSRHTLVQNTGSVLALLDAAREQRRPQVAFAFLDGGCANEAGMARLLRRKKGGATFYAVENIAADAELFAVGHSESRLRRVPADFERVDQPQEDDRVVHLIAANRDGADFSLSLAQLKKRRINDQNMETIERFIARLQ